MAESKVSKGSKAYNVIVSIIYIVIGILFILSILNVDTLLGYFIGGSLIIAGLVFVLVDVINLKYLRGLTIAVSTFALGFGIAMMISPLPFQFYLSVAVVVFGALLLLNGVIFIVRKATGAGIGMLILGAAALTFGILFLTLDDFRGYCALVFGIVLVVLGVIYLIEALSGKKIITR